MFYSNHKLSVIITLSFILFFSFCFFSPVSHPISGLSKIAVANWGPHASLQETIVGMKEELDRLGFKENQEVVFEILDVNFEPTLIMQMLSKLKAGDPKVLVAMATPVAQVAKNSVKNIPLVFADVTDPVQAGLLKFYDKPEANITGASDLQNLNVFINFAKKLLPKAQKIGLLYATGESNDAALVKMMQKAAKDHGLELVAVPVEQARDIPIRMKAFKNTVDFIYVGTSGPIQPSLPVIVSEASRMQIPVFNADSEAVKKHQVLGSFGVTYYQVGVNTARIIAKILRGEEVGSIAPIYPGVSDHQGYISQKQAKKLGITLPVDLQQITLVE